MPELKVDLRTCDVGAVVSSPKAFVSLLMERTFESWESGADLVLWPEFSWLGLERFVSAGSRAEKNSSALKEVAVLFWHHLWPEMVKQLSNDHHGVVMGSVPYLMAEGKLRNRVPMMLGRQESCQDKLNLTPWEDQFSGGEGLRLFEFQGIRMAVVVCLDIEVPEISVALRGKNVDLLLVPSATENLLGVERVGRCASARAVELGCYVGVSHLVGKGDSSLVDENVGRLAWLAPSQSPFGKKNEQNQVLRECYTPLIEMGFECLRGVLDLNKLTRMRKRKAETNPAFLSTAIPKILDG